MTTGGVPRFGDLPAGAEHWHRRGAYGIASRGGRILLVEAPYGWALPGGGVRPDEAAGSALAREFLEETGYEIRSTDAVAVAEQVLWDAGRSMFVVKECTFFACQIGGVTSGGAEADHTPAWVWSEGAADLLIEEASAWAVRTILAAGLLDG